MAEQPRPSRVADDGAMEERTFAAWISSTLTHSDVNVTDLSTDLCDGSTLLLLGAELTQQKLPKWNKTPKMRVQQIENINIFLRLVRASKVKLHNIGAEEIVDGNKKIILGLLWQLIHHFRLQSICVVVEEPAADGTTAQKASLLSGEEALLRWCQLGVAEYELPMTNFTSCWADGRAFCAILEHHFPGCMDNFASVMGDMSPAARLDLAFNVAESTLKVAQLLEAKDLLDERRINAHSVILYVAMLQASITARLDSKELDVEKEKQLEIMQRQLNDELSQLEQQLSESSKAASHTEEERVAAQQRLEEIQAQLGVTEGEKQRLRDRLAEQEEERLRLQKRVEEEEAEKAKMMASHEVMVREMEAAQGRVEQQLAEEEQRRIAFENASAELEARMDELKVTMGSETDDVKLRLEQSEAHVAKLTDMLKKEHEQAVHLQLARNKVMDDLQQAKKDMKIMTKKMEDHRHDMNREFRMREKTLREDPSMSSPEPRRKSLLTQRRRTNTTTSMPTEFGLQHTAVVKEGWLSKESGSTKGKIERRFFKLEGLELAYFRDPTDKEARKSIPLSHSVHVKLKTEPPFSFELLTPSFNNRKFLLVATSDKERDDWVRLIQERVGYEKYVHHMTSLSQQPDARVLNFFARQTFVELDLSGSLNSLETVSAIAIPLQHHAGLRVLSMKSSNLTDLEVGILCKSISANRALEELILSDNAIKTDGCKELAAMLKGNGTLTRLDLSENQVDDDGLIAIATVLPEHRCLSSLNLTSNRIGSRGAKAFAAALGSDHVMPVVQLGGNLIDETAGTPLGELLEGNATVTDLDVNDNNLGDRGFMDLVTYLVENTTLMTMHLAGNGITDEAADVLGMLMQQNKTVQSVELSANSIGPNLVDSLNALTADAVPRQSIYYSQFTIVRKVWESRLSTGAAQ